MAGKQAGGDIGSGTRSSLMYETIRIVGKLRPKYVVWENVKNLLSKAHKHNFDAYIETMKNLGYVSYYEVLNAKDYGIPQNRERIFTISIRKDVNFEYSFPKKEELKIRLKDILEQEVDEKYYLKDYQIENIKKSSYIQKQKIIQEKECCDTLLARDWKDPKCVEVVREYGIFDTEKSKHQAGSVYNKEGLAPTLDTMQGGWRQPCVEVSDPQIIKYDAKIKVKIRKYPVDVKKLKQVLRDAKVETDLTNSKIAFELDVPITTVEHWFRKDNSFAIPDEEVWYKLKRLLCINTCEFDESITTFEEKDNVYEKNGRIYDTNGIAPTLTLSEEKIVDPKIEVVGNYMPSGHDASRIVDSKGIAPTVKENHGTVTAIIEEKNMTGIDLTWNEIGKTTDIGRTLTTSCRTLCKSQFTTGATDGLRIRKLTPREVWRLMGFDDEDFEKAEKVNSNTQLYKQARKLNRGKSIRKNLYKLIERGLNV